MCVCVCMFVYPYLSSVQCSCAVLYCYLWPVRLYNIFPILSHKQRDSREKVIEHKYVFLFVVSANLVKHFSFYEESRKIS
jgi:hypothetical protein